MTKCEEVQGGEYFCKPLYLLMFVFPQDNKEQVKVTKGWSSFASSFPVCWTEKKEHWAVIAVVAEQTKIREQPTET